MLELNNGQITFEHGFNGRLNSTLPNSSSENLFEAYNSAINTLLPESIIYGHSTLNDNYLNIFERMKALYQLEDQITEETPVYSTNFNHCST